MIDKTTSAAKALEALREGCRIMVGGFGAPGTPFTLLEEVLALGIGGLTLVKNDANEPGVGISKLIEAGRVRALIASHIGLNPVAVAMMQRGELEVELHPQGILAEKIRAGGAGLLGILTDIGIDTPLREGRRIVEVEGREAILELPLRADLTLIHAALADTAGNLIFAKSARNFCPLMATAADRVVVEAEEVVAAGTLDPESIHLPGAFVDHIVALETLTPEYGVLPQHVV